MTARIADEGGMQSRADPLAVDELIAERVVRGEDVGSLPRAYERLADVLAGIREPASAAELAGERDAVAAFRRVGPRPGAGAAARRRRHRVRTALVISAVTTLGVAGGAAATGRLPDRVQDAASALLERVGIDIPEADHPVTPPARSEFEAAEDVEPMVGRPNTATPPPATARLRVSRAPSTPAVAPPDHRDACGRAGRRGDGRNRGAARIDRGRAGLAARRCVAAGHRAASHIVGSGSRWAAGWAADDAAGSGAGWSAGARARWSAGSGARWSAGSGAGWSAGAGAGWSAGAAARCSAGSSAGWSAGAGAGWSAGAGARWSAGAGAGWSPRSGSRWAAG